MQNTSSFRHSHYYYFSLSCSGSERKSIKKLSWHFFNWEAEQQMILGKNTVNHEIVIIKFSELVINPSYWNKVLSHS